MLMQVANFYVASEREKGDLFFRQTVAVSSKFIIQLLTFCVNNNDDIFNRILKVTLEKPAVRQTLESFYIHSLATSVNADVLVLCYV